MEPNMNNYFVKRNVKMSENLYFFPKRVTFICIKIEVSYKWVEQFISSKKVFNPSYYSL